MFMNAKLLTASCLALAAPLGFAFELPRGVHRIDELEQARAKAAERPELVSFLISQVSLAET